MKSSHNDRQRKQASAIEPLPPMLSSMWRLCKLGFRHERGLMAASLAMEGIVTRSVPAWVPSPIAAGAEALLPRHAACAYSASNALTASAGLFTTW